MTASGLQKRKVGRERPTTLAEICKRLSYEDVHAAEVVPLVLQPLAPVPVRVSRV